MYFIKFTDIIIPNILSSLIVCQTICNSTLSFTYHLKIAGSGISWSSQFFSETVQLWACATPASNPWYTEFFNTFFSSIFLPYLVYSFLRCLGYLLLASSVVSCHRWQQVAYTFKMLCTNASRAFDRVPKEVKQKQSIQQIPQGANRQSLMYNNNSLETSYVFLFLPFSDAKKLLTKHGLKYLWPPLIQVIGG